MVFNNNDGAQMHNTNDRTSQQPNDYKAAHPTPEVMRTSNGAPVWSHTAALTVGPMGPMLMQDVVYIDSITQFDRERVPERVVHAKGMGAHGFFEVTHDITKYCKADLFSEIGKKTPLFIRFSNVGTERGGPDTVRDLRGFAIKFYTEEGNWDLVANNTPIFFIRDPMMFPAFIHTLKPNPVTNTKHPNPFFDFCSLRPESMHQLLWLHGDRGTPDGFRHMNGYGSHTFKMVNKQGVPVYCKFHIKSKQGIKNLTSDEARKYNGDDPDYATRDLYEAIDRGDYPEWEFFIQVMTFDQAKTHPFNPFDLTKVWYHKDYPLIPVGRIVLNRNIKNYFAEVEQAAFSPAHVIPGIEFSPDKMLHGRLLSYMDTQYHRIGKNYIQLPINCPFRTPPVRNMHTDGPMNLTDNQDGAPNWHPNSFHGPIEKGEEVRESRWSISGDVDRFDTANEDNYEQPRLFFEKVLDDPQRVRLVENLCGSLVLCAPLIQQRCISEFDKVSTTLGQMVRDELSRRQTFGEKIITKLTGLVV